MTCFHGPVIFLKIMDLIQWICIILGIVEQFDIVTDLVLLVGYSELYFILYRFCIEICLIDIHYGFERYWLNLYL